jgi:ribonuclease R
MKKKIKAFFKNNPGKSIKPRDLAKQLDIFSVHEYSAMKAALFDLTEEGVLSRNGKRYQLNRTGLTNTVTGALQITKAGYGFVVVDGGNMKDVFIAERNMGAAFSGDKVEVYLFANQKGKNIEGQITGIIKRKRETIIGSLKKAKSLYFVQPDDSEIHKDIFVGPEDLLKAKPGDKVVIGDIEWTDYKLNPVGVIKEVIGKAGNYATEIISIAKEYGLPVSFPAKIISELENFSFKVTPSEIKKRLDYRKKNVFTIDPVDAKDFDDALSIETLENENYSVGIHIADVSHYVKFKSALDNEAKQRGNSVYLVGRVIPMLPEILSNNVCSLVPDEERLTYSVIVELTKRGRIVDYRIKKSIIKSKRRFNYDEVQKIIEGANGDFKDDILLLNKLARTLRVKRIREGSIEFSTDEVKFDLDETGAPINAYIKKIKESNNLVEEFMLIANQIVARHISTAAKKAERPFVYRVHDRPDKEKIAEFARFVKTLGFAFDAGSAKTSLQFQKLIEKTRGHDDEILINELAIRSMAKAVYSPKNIGHYGLGFGHYTHFTSPIRRYSDLIVHRLINLYEENPQKIPYTFAELQTICEHISQTERNAVEAERNSVRMMQIAYMKNHLGDEFEGIISGIVHFGFFVKLKDTLAEGLIRLRDLDDDFYIFDEKKYSFIGRSTKKQYRLGDVVTVKLIRIDEERAELDFIIPEEF